LHRRKIPCPRRLHQEHVLIANNITMQFGAKPLFENVSVKFGDGNRYGLIGANGAGKSTFMKILAGVLEPSAGNVSLDTGERMAFLRQDQFAYEDVRVLDVVMMGHEQMWACMQEKDAIYANPEATEDDYMHAAELEGEVRRVRRLHRRIPRRRAAARRGHPDRAAQRPDARGRAGLEAARAAGQALFANPDILLLDEPTNNLDINTIRWLEACSTSAEHHDHHLPRPPLPEPGVHPHGGPGLRPHPGVPRQLRRLHGSVDPGARAAGHRQCQGQGTVADLQEFVRRFSANKSKARQATSRAKQIEKIKDRGRSSPRRASTRGSASTTTRRTSCTGRPVEIENLTFGYDPKQAGHQELQLTARSRRQGRHHRRERRRQDHAAALLVGRLAAAAPVRHRQVGREGQARLLRPGPCRRFRLGRNAHRLDQRLCARRRLRRRRRRNPDPRHARPPAVRRRRREEVGQGDLRRRAGPHAVRQADAAAPTCC
jgi:ABC-type branched-subunit amino acid transport system ATPase component